MSNKLKMLYHQRQALFLDKVYPDSGLNQELYVARIKGLNVDEVVERVDAYINSLSWLAYYPVNCSEMEIKANVNFACEQRILPAKKLDFIRQRIRNDFLNIQSSKTDHLPIRGKVYAVGQVNYLALEFHHFGFTQAAIKNVLHKVQYNLYANKLSHGYDFENKSQIESQYRTSDKFQSDLHFWQQYLKGHQEIELYQDKPRPSDREYVLDIASQTTNYDNQQLSAIALTTALSNDELMIAVIHLYLILACASDQFTIGYEFETTDDFDNNLIPVFYAVDRSCTIQQFLKAYVNSLVRVKRYNNIQLGDIIDHVGIEKEINKSPLFQVIVSCVDNTKIEDFERIQYAMLHDLEIKSNTTSSTITVNYHKQLYTDQHIKYFIDGLVNFINLCVTHLDSTIEQCLGAYNNRVLISKSATKKEHFLVSFLSCVRQYPENVAMVFEGRKLSYAQLDDQTNTLAVMISERVNKARVVIGVCSNNPVTTIVACLAVIKTGNAFIFLDPEYPSRRINSIIEHVDPTLIICDRIFKHKFTQAKHDLLVYESLGNLPRTEFKAINVAIDAPAYIISTSGTTGEPKNVVLPNAALNHLARQARNFNIDSTSTMLQMASFNFDASLLEWVSALANGACLLLTNHNKLNLIHTIYNYCNEYTITHMFATPSLLKQLDLNKFQQLQALLIGAEACPMPLLHALVKHTDVYNLYGPTEVGVNCTAQYYPKDSKIKYKSSQIGKPVHGTTIAIVDQNNNILPKYSPGEICISSANIALEYANQPNVTASKFIMIEDNRYYKTGDLGIIGDDDNLDYLGRLDRQIKINGHRVELSDIDNLLTKISSYSNSFSYYDIESKRIITFIENNTNNSSENILGNWKRVFESGFDYYEANHADNFNMSGWYSSFSNKLIPEDEMRNWLQTTIKRIKTITASNSNKKVLEIGCGTGMILLNLYDKFATYHATDISRSALFTIKNALDKKQVTNVKIKLSQQEANDFQGLDDNYELVILNSVMQYFPSETYLLQVIEQIVNNSAQNGKVFLGDIRSLIHHSQFAAMVAFYHSGTEKIASSINDIMYNEGELLINPNFFLNLIDKLPRVSAVNIELKQTSDQNELTLFRYDVTISLDDKPVMCHMPNHIKWQSSLSEKVILNNISSKHALAVENIPCARWIQANKLIDASINDNYQDIKNNDLLQPEYWYEFAKKHGLNVVTTFDAKKPDACFTVIIAKEDAIYSSQLISKIEIDIDYYTNTPHQSLPGNQEEAKLLQILQQYLPSYTLPSKIKFISQFPRTVSEKIDVKALMSMIVKEHSPQAIIPPETETEKQLASIWSEILGHNDISRDHQFTDVGGTSIMMIDAFNRLKVRFDTKISLPQMMQLTLAEIAENLNNDIETEDHVKQVA